MSIFLPPSVKKPEFDAHLYIFVQVCNVHVLHKSSWLLAFSVPQTDFFHSENRIANFAQLIQWWCPYPGCCCPPPPLTQGDVVPPPLPRVMLSPPLTQGDVVPVLGGVEAGGQEGVPGQHRHRLTQQANLLNQRLIKPRWAKCFVLLQS